MILGIDEAGRGPWAGPLVVGAVVLGGALIEGLNDSKKLSKKRRNELYGQIVTNAQAFATGWVSSRELDEIGMSAALRLATRRAVEQITCSYTEIVIDGTVNFLANTTKGAYVQVLPKADSLIPSVSAASIVAKVERDRYMEHIAKDYPEYGFEKHAGYGVKEHREAIDSVGVTPEHRLSFSPLKKYTSSIAPLSVKAIQPKKELSIGEIGENAAATYLANRGYQVVERNWKTKWCEIDIIAQKDETVFFVEVKYRRNSNAGSGLDAITPKKLNQMKFAAELYSQKLSEHTDIQLMVVAVSGVSPAVESVILIE